MPSTVPSARRLPGLALPFLRRAMPALVVLGLAACAEDPVDPGPEVCSIEEQRYIPVHSRPLIDLLIVVDRSPSMADNASDLATNAGDLGAELDFIRSNLSDLHVAVITSDLGAAGVPGCDADGDRAAFQRAAACGVDGSFVADRRAGDDSDDRVRNYGGTLEDTLGCLLDVPLSSCAVSQPLAAVTLALAAPPGSQGFRRPGARLHVVVITDGDDCSLVDPAAINAPITGDVEATIDFRCFARGTTCTPSDPAAAGLHHDCAARDDGGLISVERTLAALGNDVWPVSFAIIAGSADATVTGPGVRLAPSCTGEREVGPAPRLASIAPQSQRDHRLIDACTPVWDGSLITLTRETLEGRWACFEGVVDRDPLVAGVQAECTASLLQRTADGGTRELDPLRFCDDPTRAPDSACIFWELAAGNCGDPTETQLAIDVNGETRRDLLGIVSCAAACSPAP